MGSGILIDPLICLDYFVVYVFFRCHFLGVLLEFYSSFLGLSFYCVDLIFYV